MAQQMTENEKNSMLMKGIVIGGLIGGVFSLIDAKTRTQLKETAVDLKTTSQKMLSGVKENPSEMKEQMVSQFNQVTNVLKEALSDAQKLYERLNEDLFSKMGDFKAVSSDALSTVKGAKDDLKQIGSKIVDAGSELKGITNVPGGNEGENSSSGNSVGGSSQTDEHAKLDAAAGENSNESEKLKTEAAGNSSEKIETFGTESSFGISDQSGQAGDANANDQSAGVTECKKQTYSSQKHEGQSAGLKDNNETYGSQKNKGQSVSLNSDTDSGKHTYVGQETPNQK
ncbi:hypothetical protein ACQYAD_01645 [Neobacillus sp. SM06]|uniref:hypothetical protein n=1 Tax=Neobacillus sp. SM06 TaxID=3422492 RepID=UPI003D2C161C